MQTGLLLSPTHSKKTYQMDLILAPASLSLMIRSPPRLDFIVASITSYSGTTQREGLSFALPLHISSLYSRHRVKLVFQGLLMTLFSLIHRNYLRSYLLWCLEPFNTPNHRCFLKTLSSSDFYNSRGTWLSHCLFALSLSRPLPSSPEVLNHRWTL